MPQDQVLQIMLGKALAKAARPPYIRVLGRQCRTEGRDVAQPGSASHWGCGGRRFESSRPDQYTNLASILCFKSRFLNAMIATTKLGSSLL